MEEKGCGSEVGVVRRMKVKRGVGGGGGGGGGRGEGGRGGGGGGGGGGGRKGYVEVKVSSETIVCPILLCDGMVWYGAPSHPVEGITSWSLGQCHPHAVSRSAHLTSQSY